jgi:hypothetical protein
MSPASFRDTLAQPRPIADPRGGLGTVNNFYVTHPLGTPDAIAAAVDKAVTESAKNRGVRMG